MSLISRTERKRKEDPQNVPVLSRGQDLLVVDTTWGVIQPLEPVLGVATVGELELIELVNAGALLVDTRVPDSRSDVTLVGAVNLPHDAISELMEQLSDGLNVLFCNGPQCPQTPDALRSLIAAGVPATCLRYYRGGLHDWMTLGYPTQDVDS